MGKREIAKLPGWEVSQTIYERIADLAGIMGLGNRAEFMIRMEELLYIDRRLRERLEMIEHAEGKETQES